VGLGNLALLLLPCVWAFVVGAKANVPNVCWLERNFKKCEELAFSFLSVNGRSGNSPHSKTRSGRFAVRLVNMVCMSSSFSVIVLLCRPVFKHWL